MTRLSSAWLTKPHVIQVLDALGVGYFVGGCVRNALLDGEDTDIDIATPLLPDEVIRRLRFAEIKVVATGLAHGTVTAITEGGTLEITTFRADVSTDGRRATVAFSDNIALDAARRDFTMNAIYADRQGNVIDPLDGLSDLQERRVRFIGCPSARIREDFLRILRFFRFHAWYGGPDVDAEGLAACAELADGLDTLARERVGWEFRKLLSAVDPAPAVASMAVSGVLLRCLPGANAGSLATLVHLEDLLEVPIDWRTRLLALGKSDWSKELRLSRGEQQHLAAVVQAIELGDAVMTAYHSGYDVAASAVLISAAGGAEMPPGNWRAELLEAAAAEFPLAAQDLIDAGWEPGPKLGEALREAETTWIGSGFRSDRAELLRSLSD